jgi:hypothetical protein
MYQWLPLTDYATKYKVSVSTLRRRIKAEDIKYLFQEGKYFISDEPITTFASPIVVNTAKTSPSLGFFHAENVESAYPEKLNPDFLENLKKSANTKLPSVKDEVGILNKQKYSSPPAFNIEEEYYFKNQDRKKITEQFESVQPESNSKGIKEFSEKISKISSNEPILTAANKLLAELKKAYTQILHEKEDQITLLKEEVSDLKTLVKVLESENARIKDYNAL